VKRTPGGAQATMGNEPSRPRPAAQGGQVPGSEHQAHPQQSDAVYAGPPPLQHAPGAALRGQDSQTTKNAVVVRAVTRRAPHFLAGG